MPGARLLGHGWVRELSIIWDGFGGEEIPMPWIKFKQVHLAPVGMGSSSSVGLSAAQLGQTVAPTG